MNFLASIAVSIAALAADQPAGAADLQVAITVQVKSEKPILFTAGDLGKLGRAKVEAGRDKDPRTYEGVPLANLLETAGITWGTKCSTWLDCYVIVTGADDYRALFSIPEIDPGLARKSVLIADRCNGKPLSRSVGPYEVIEEDAKQRGRWVRQATTIQVAIGMPPTPAADAAHAVHGNAVQGDAAHKGAVYLIGMGPGDAELVTFKAAKALKDADSVFCFRYLKDEVARYALPTKITVASPLLMGKAYGRNPADLSPEMRKELEESKEELAQFVVKVRNLVAAGKTVVFADAGDPTVYCPWSWIAEEFADLHPVVVPGLSSFNAANAALKQSITRNSGSVLISSGEDLGEPDKNGRLKTMLVVFTHHAKLKELAPRLLARYPADTPAAVVCEASYPTQRVVWATLGTLLEKTADQRLPHLYLVYVGDGLKSPGNGSRSGK